MGIDSERRMKALLVGGPANGRYIDRGELGDICIVPSTIGDALYRLVKIHCAPQPLLFYRHDSEINKAISGESGVNCQVCGEWRCLVKDDCFIEQCPVCGDRSTYIFDVCES